MKIHNWTELTDYIYDSLEIREPCDAYMQMTEAERTRECMNCITTITACDYNTYWMEQVLGIIAEYKARIFDCIAINDGYGDHLLLFCHDGDDVFTIEQVDVLEVADGMEIIDAPEEPEEEYEQENYYEQTREGLGLDDWYCPACMR